MKSALLTFRKEISSLIAFLEAAAAEDALLPSLRDAQLDGPQRQHLDAVLNARTVRRRYAYATTVVALYGGLERFVEDALHGYLVLLKRVCGKYALFPESITKKHMALSIDYMALVRDGRTRANDDVKDVVARLRDCLVDEEQFELNYHAFTARAQNVNRESARRLFGNVGIELSPQRLFATKAANDFAMSREVVVEGPQSDESVRTLFSGVDFITTARNLVAHGVTDIDQIDDADVLRAYIEEVSSYVESLFEILLQEAFSLIVALERSKKLGSPTAVYDHRIVCFPLVDGEIGVGDLIVMPTEIVAEPIRFSNVLTLEVDNVAHDNISGAPDLKFGMSVSFRALKSAEYHLIPRDIVMLLDE